VDVATSAAEAREEMAGGRYDVIVSDYQMPVEDGIQFLKSLRASENSIPFILFTGKGREDVVIEAINNGADAYLQKGGDSRSLFAELDHRIGMVVRRHRAEAALLDSESEFRTLFEDNPDAISLVSMDGRILNCNHAAAKMVMMNKEEIIGGTVADLGVFSPDDLAFFQRTMRDRMNGILGSPVLSQIRRRDGSQRWMEIRSSIVRKSGKFHGFQIICRDMTEQRNAEEALRKSESKFRAIFTESPVGIATLDLEGRPRDFNQVFDHFGYSEEEFSRKSFSEFTHPDDRERNVALFKDLVAGKIDRFEIDKRYVRKDGSTVWARLYEKRVEGIEDGSPAILAIIEDLTELKEAEEAKDESTTRLQTLVEAIPDLIWLKDKDGVYLSCNKMLGRLYGAKESEIVGKTDHDFVLPEQADFFRENDAKAMETGGPIRSEEWATMSGGHRILLEVIKTPMYDANGNLIGVLGIGRDITERKKAENELRRYSSRLSILNGIISAANKSDDLPQLLGFVLSETLRLLDFDAGGVYLVDHAARTANVVCSKNLDPEFLKDVQTVEIDHKPYDTLFIMGEPIIAENYAQINAERSERYGLLSIASIPLLSKGEVVGAMNVASTVRNLISDEDRETLASIGRELGSSIRRMMSEERATSAILRP
jgi:PAS domain S-box-containing protein